MKKIECPGCFRLLFEAEGKGTVIRLVCKCHRVIVMDENGQLTILGDRNILTKRAG